MLWQRLIIRVSQMHRDRLDIVIRMEAVTLMVCARMELLVTGRCIMRRHITEAAQDIIGQDTIIKYRYPVGNLAVYCGVFWYVWEQKGRETFEKCRRCEPCHR